MTYGVSSDRIKVLSYGKERPVIQDLTHFHGQKIEDQLQ